jgi:TRAP-type C4-dicarboxylate transport system substrate-binding protein
MQEKNKKLQKKLEEILPESIKDEGMRIFEGRAEEIDKISNSIYSFITRQLNHERTGRSYYGVGEIKIVFE